MTKKDFIFIAAVIRSLPDSIREEVAVKFADRLGEANALFKTNRFLVACGADTQGGK